MSDPLIPQPEQAKHATYKAGGGLIVQPQPDEFGVGLRKDDFLTLCEGDIGEARASRDVCIGISCTALVGLAGVLAAIDWDTILKSGIMKIVALAVLVVFLIVGASGSAVGALIHNSRLKRTTENSPYSRLKARLLKGYDAQQAASQRSNAEQGLERLKALSDLAGPRNSS